MTCARVLIVADEDPKRARARFGAEPWPGIELEALRPGERGNGGPGDVLVVAPSVPEPLTAAQAFRRTNPDGQVVFLLPADRLDRFERMLPFAPDLAGTKAVDAATPAGQLRQRIKEAVEAGRSRRAIKGLYGRINAQVGSRPTAKEQPDRRQQHQALAERYLAALLTHAPDALFAVALDGSVVSWNTAAARLFGRSWDEIAGQSFVDLLPPETRPPAADVLQRAGMGESIKGQELRVLDPGGPVRILELSAGPILGGEGTIEGVSLTARDVTERKEAEEKLAESEARLKTVFDTVPVGIVLAEAPSGRIVGGNAQVERIFGHPVLPSADVDGYRQWVSYHPDGRVVDAAEYPLAQVLRGGEDRPELEVLYQRSDGRQAWVRLIGAPIRNAAGRITGGLVACLDIDRQKRAEAELRDLNATLARRVEDAIAERDRIWRLAAELMLVARFDAQIVAINPAWASVLGWSDGELIGTSFIDLVHPDDRAGTLAEAARLAEGISTLRFENRCRHKDGSYRRLSWTAVSDQNFIHAIARDVTAEREAAEALRRTEEKLRQSQKMEVVGQLTGGVAHDFNNLLTVVTGHLDIAQRRLEATDGDARVVRNIQSAVEGAKRAATLTHRLLAFSRQSPLQPEVVDPNKLVAGMSELIRRTLGETIAIETVLAGGLWQTEADPNQIENAILNLCVNARDAMPEGGKLTIETANTHLDDSYPAVVQGEVKAGQYILIAVSDTGFGMPPEVRDRVFEPFFTTKAVGKGTGLGLSQVYGFLRQSGGHAAIYSEVGEGTTVKLYFPRLKRLAEAKAEATLPKLLPIDQGQGETILVVEDEDMVREFTASALEELGYVVLTAADGPSGLALLEAHPEVSLLFTDVVLAGPLNGRKVADEALRRRPGLKVLFTTGYTRNAIVHHGRLDEGVELITKPFTAQSLAAKIRRVLEA